MDGFIKSISLTLIVVVLCLFVGKRDKDIAMLLSLLACCMLLIVAIQYLKPVFRFFEYLREVGNIESDMLSVLMQVVGVGLIAQVMGGICTDAGYGAIGKSVHILGTAVTLSASLPAFNKLLELLEGIISKL